MLNQEYNINWLRTEYRTAIKSAQDGSKWLKLNQEKDVFPYLEYRSTRDGRVRDEHKELDGIIKPVDSPFWDTYYPPNGFNCRCRIIQRETGPASRTGKLPPPDSPLFEQNVGKSGEVFPTKGKGKHPYFEGVPKQKAAELKKKATPFDGLNYIPNNVRKHFPKVAREEFSPFWAKFQKQSPATMTKTNSYYSPNDKKVRIDSSYRNGRLKVPEKIVFHEYGHALDDQIGFTRSGAYKDPIYKIELKTRKRAAKDTDFRNFLGESSDRGGGKAFGKYGEFANKLAWDFYEADKPSLLSDFMLKLKNNNSVFYDVLVEDGTPWFKDLIKYAESKAWTTEDFSNAWVSFADITAQSTSGYIGRGHSKSYWRSLAGPWEFFAHLNEARFVKEYREFWSIIDKEITDIVVKAGDDFYK